MFSGSRRQLWFANSCTSPVETLKMGLSQNWGYPRMILDRHLRSGKHIIFFFILNWGLRVFRATQANCSHFGWRSKSFSATMRGVAGRPAVAAVATPCRGAAGGAGGNSFLDVNSIEDWSGGLSVFWRCFCWWISSQFGRGCVRTQFCSFWNLDNFLSSFDVLVRTASVASLFSKDSNFWLS